MDGQCGGNGGGKAFGQDGLGRGSNDRADVKPFSTSRIVELNINVGPELKDVERNDFTFTDGCSVAGIEVMRQAATALGAIRGLDACPSAIQFRLG
jgi:hypothetical protein